MADAAVMSAQQLVVTDSAAARIAELAAREGQPGLMLRIAISGGGCSGFQYGFDLDDKANDDDRVFAHGDSRVVVDEVSFDLIGGAMLAFVEDFPGSYFPFPHPHAH